MNDLTTELIALDPTKKPTGVAILDKTLHLEPLELLVQLKPEPMGNVY